MSTTDPYNKYIEMADEITALVKRMPCEAEFEKQLLIMAAKILKGYNVALCIKNSDSRDTSNDNQYEQL